MTLLSGALITSSPCGDADEERAPNSNVAFHTFRCPTSVPCRSTCHALDALGSKATVLGFNMSARWIPCPRIYASCRFRHKFGCPEGAALTPRTRRRPTSWTTVDHGFIELIRKGFAALRRPRESESRDASVRGVGGEGAVLPIRSCGTDQPRQPAHTWGHPGETKRRAAVNQRPAIPKRMRSGSSGRTRTYKPPVNSRMLYH